MIRSPIPHFSAPSHLPTSTTFPLSHALQLPLFPPTTTFTPTTLLPPFIYHCQSNSIIHPPLNCNATATPPSLLVTNNNMTLSPSLIYQ